MIAPDETLLTDRYMAVRPTFELVAQHVNDLIKNRCPQKFVHKIEYRAKTLESFLKKAQKYNVEGNYKYTDPFNQITDFSGVRVICFLQKSVDEICDNILEMFGVEKDKIEDVGERVFQKGRFGYQSKHILVHLPKNTYLPSCDFIDTISCEIQVRTILQHAWAEMEHDIQYKGESVPDNLRKRFAALAGLLEIADGEFERIQQASMSIKSVVEQDLFANLTAQALESKNQESTPGEREAIKSVRSLIASGAYEEALKRYDSKIAGEPNSYTLLIGRAKVKFLLGDAQSALNDLDQASMIKPSDPAIFNLRNLILSGDIDAAKQVTMAQNVSPSEIDRAFESIRNGDGVTAFSIISDLEAEGYNKAFAFVNKAMCCIIEKDYEGANEHLALLKIISGTPMSVNILTLKIIISILSGTDPQIDIDELQIALNLTPHFSLSQSHIKHLFCGLKTVQEDKYEDIERKLEGLISLTEVCSP